MSDCKKMFNKDVFAYLMTVMPDDIKKELTNCDEMTGGRRKRKMRRKMRGGDPAFRKKVIVGIYLFMGIVLSYILGNMDKTTLIRGFEMLYNGQCNTMSELALDFLGIGNPICSAHHRMIVLIGCAMKGHTEALMQILGTIATSIASPFLLHAAVDRAASIIEGRVSALMGPQGLTIEDINRPNTIQGEQNILTALGDTPAITAAITAEEIKDEIERLGLMDQIRALLNLKEMTDETRIEEIHEAASRVNSKESSQEHGGSRRKRSNSKRRKISHKHKKYTRKHKKNTRKYRRK
jgi:hypothetical protein